MQFKAIIINLQLLLKENRKHSFSLWRKVSNLHSCHGSGVMWWRCKGTKHCSL